LVLFILIASASSDEPEAAGEPYWTLLHEPAVVAELKLTATQRASYQELLDGLDLRFFPFRNKSREEATAGLVKLVEEAQQKLKTLLKPEQLRRFNEVVFWRLGTATLLRDDVAEKLRFSDSQRKQIKKIAEETQHEVSALEKESREGKSREPLEKKYTELKTSEQKQMLEIITPDQQQAWKKLLGPSFDVGKLNQAAYKAPELIDTGEWINATKPLQIEKLQGKVVVVHFYASGCINCIHNYPSYRQWQEAFKSDDVQLIGIHTPETEGERVTKTVRQKAAAEKFTFPILIDGKSQNWNAWGNSMWPSVYVLDKRGYLRNFWPGELKWQGAEGDKFLTERIEKLIAE
jgi:thiol-disulfide isomerase/thioredoxin